MSFSSKQYFAYQERLLEPDSRIIMGNAKRIHEVKRSVVIHNPSPDTRTQEEIERMEDAFLLSHRVPVTPKKY